MIRLGIIIYFTGLISFVLNKNILIMLLRLEFIILGLFINIILLIRDLSFEIIIIFMVFSVSEASLGLGLLVLNVIKEGISQLDSKKLLKW